MALPRYLAMTAAEFASCTPLPERIAWMACHFSSYGTGLSNRPPALPEGSMVILNDRTPICGHDPELILRQLEELEFESLLLDFQRPGSPETAALTACLAGRFSRPMAVSHLYGAGLECPVFLPPAPLDVPLGEYLKPWQGREIWLEAALTQSVIRLTSEGATQTPLPYAPRQRFFTEDTLCIRYCISQDGEFTLWRSPEGLEALLEQAQALGVTRAVGLYQEIGTPPEP